MTRQASLILAQAAARRADDPDQDPLVCVLEALRLTLAAGLADNVEALPQGEWMFVALDGGRRLYGLVRGVSFAGTDWVEVVEPAVWKDGAPLPHVLPLRPRTVTRFNPSAIYSMTPATEDAVMNERSQTEF